MKIVGCDLHTRYQQVAMLDEETVLIGHSGTLRSIYHPHWINPTSCLHTT